MQKRHICFAEIIDSQKLSKMHFFYYFHSYTLIYSYMTWNFSANATEVWRALNEMGACAKKLSVAVRYMLLIAKNKRVENMINVSISEIL